MRASQSLERSIVIRSFFCANDFKEVRLYRSVGKRRNLEKGWLIRGWLDLSVLSVFLYGIS